MRISDWSSDVCSSDLLADRAARAIMDDGRGDSRAPTAVSVIDMLDHLLAPLMFEIDVDVGRLVALGRNEAREKQRVFHRIDRGDAEQEADDRIGRRTAPLAQDRRFLGARAAGTE